MAQAAKEVPSGEVLAPSAPDGKPVMQTSLAVRGTPPGEVTVRFRRWTAVNVTAYQRGQYAGFPLPVALRLEAQGAVEIDPGVRRRPIDEQMIRK